MSFSIVTIDTFTEESSPYLTSHISDDGYGWTRIIGSNSLRIFNYNDYVRHYSGSSSVCVHVLDYMPTSADTGVEADIYLLNAGQDYYAPKLVVRYAGGNYYYIWPKIATGEISVERAGGSVYTVGAIPYAIPLTTNFNLTVDVITNGAQVDFEISVDGVPLGTISDTNANRILAVGQAGILNRYGNVWRLDNFAVRGIPQGIASVGITQPIYDRSTLGEPSVEITQDIVIPRGQASVGIKQSIHQGQGSASVEITQIVEVMPPFVFDPVEGMYDSFTTGGDTLLTAHTSESGHTWSSIAGWSDTLTVQTANERVYAATEGAALCSYTPTSANMMIAFTNLYMGDSVPAGTGPSLIVRTTDGTDGYRIQYNNVSGEYDIHRQADDSLVGSLSKWDLGHLDDTPNVIFHIQNLHNDSQVIFQIYTWGGYIWNEWDYPVIDKSPSRVTAAGKVALIGNDAAFHAMTIVEDAYLTEAYDSFTQWGAGNQELSLTVDAAGFLWKKQTTFTGSLNVIDATGTLEPSGAAAAWMYYTLDDNDHAADDWDYGVWADITLNDVATNTQVPALTLYTSPWDNSYKWLNVIPQPLTNEIIVVWGLADGGTLQGSVPYTFSAGVEFRLHAQGNAQSQSQPIIDIFVDDTYIDSVYTGGIDWFYDGYPGIAGYQQGTWEIAQWGQTRQFLTVPPPQGSSSLSVTQSIQDDNRLTVDTFTESGGDTSLADHLSDDGFYWYKHLANWDTDIISVIDANDRVRGPGGNSAWLWYWCDILPMSPNYILQADIRTETKASDTYSVQMMLRMNQHTTSTSWYYIYPKHLSNKIEIRRYPSLILDIFDYSFPTTGEVSTIRAEIQTLVDSVEIAIYVDDTLIGKAYDTSAERILEAGRAGIAVTQNATADNFQFSIMQGSISLPIQQRVVDPGFASVEITQEVTNPRGLVSVEITQTIEANTGYCGVYITQKMVAQGSVSVDITQTITNPQGIASVEITQQVFTPGLTSVEILQSITDPVALTADHADWKARVTLDGVDISEDITGEIRVEAEENGSRIAEFEFDPPAGLLEIMEWVATPVTIDYLIKEAGGTEYSVYRIFTGIVDVPEYDPVTQLVRINATDHLQGRFEQATHEEITDLIGGEWSRHVFDEEVDGWQYFQDRLTTQPYSYDLDVNGVGVKAPWLAKVTPDFTYTNDTIDDESVITSFASRRDIINKGLINLDFRFQRMRERRHTIAWELYPGFIDYLGDPFIWPTKSMCDSAVAGGGWVLESIIYIEAPESGVYNVRREEEGGYYPVAWILTPGFAANYCQGFYAMVSNKWAQTITEEYEFEVICQQSIDQLGPIHEEFDYGVECEQDIVDWEDTEAPGFSISAAETDGIMTSSASIGAPWEGEEYLDADETDIENGRAEMENAQVCAIEVAKTSILNTHRNNHVEYSSFLEPQLERHHTVYINTGHIDAKGKVHGYIHTMDPDAGTATTEVTLSISKVLASGLPFNSPITPAPKPDIEPDQSVVTGWGGLSTHIGGRLESFNYSEDMRGFITNYEWDPDTQDFTSEPLPAKTYPYEFVIETPEIEEEARQPVIGSSTITVHVEVPDELMDITTT